MIFKCRTQRIAAAMLARGSFLVAQSEPVMVPSGQREILYRRPNPGTASHTHTFLWASRDE